MNPKGANRATGKIAARILKRRHGTGHPAYFAAKALARSGRQANLDAFLETLRDTLSDEENHRFADELEIAQERVTALQGGQHGPA